MQKETVGFILILFSILCLSIAILESIWDMMGYVFIPAIGFLVFFFSGLEKISKSNE